MVVVGNRERQGNGQTIFRSMYGDEDQAFTFGRALFVLFDNNGAELDLQWLDRKLSAKEQARPTAVGSKLTKPELLRFVVAHKPPFDPTPAGDHAMEVGAEEYHGLMVKHDVSLSIHGHIHSYWHGTHRGIRYLISGGAGAELVGSSKYHFSKLRVDGDELSVEQVVVAD